MQRKYDFIELYEKVTVEEQKSIKRSESWINFRIERRLENLIESKERKGIEHIYEDHNKF